MSNGKRILAIDDDPSMLVLVSNILGAAGFEVEIAADGSAALSSIRQSPPDLVVCDVQMPGLDGFQVLDRVRGDRTTAGLPFVLLTGLNDRESVRRGMRLGADDFLSMHFRWKRSCTGITCRASREPSPRGRRPWIWPE
jgi:CheY-like chemotaxis protein